MGTESILRLIALPTGVFTERRHAPRPFLPEWEEYSTKTQTWLAAKRAFDILGALALLTATLPLFLFLAIWIPLDSRGLIFFRNKRRGFMGRTFEVLKFRTMHREAHLRREELVSSHDGKHRLLFKIKRDPRITPLGQFLRKYSLDELPQLINVLRGEMSLIGPRPLLKEDFEGVGAARAASSGEGTPEWPGPLFRQWVRDRHRLRPGITGLWQVSGRNDLSFEDSMRLDLLYVTEWSPRLDLKILLKTPLAVIAGRGAY